MSLQSDTKNPYMIQFKTPTACNCSDDCTCAQCVVENTSGLGNFMKNAAGAAKDLVRTPFKVVSAIGNSVKMSRNKAEMIAHKWQNKGAIRRDEETFEMAVLTLQQTNSEKDAREKLRSTTPQIYFTQKDRDSRNQSRLTELKQSHAETVEQEKHDGILSGIKHRGNQQKILQQRAQEIENAHHKAGLFNMFGHSRPAAVSNTPASSHGIMPHFSIPHPHVPFSHVSRPHVIMPGRMREACIL